MPTVMPQWCAENVEQKALIVPEVPNSYAIPVLKVEGTPATGVAYYLVILLII